MTRRRDLAPFAIVAAIGVGLAVLQYVLDNKDPLVFSLPILGVTFVLLLVMAIARSGNERGPEGFADLQEQTGLRDGGIAPLPQVTPILADVHEPAHVLTGRLPGHGPRVRLARVGDRLVSISETNAGALDEETGDWLVLHPLRPQAGVEEGLLVVAVPAGTGGRALLDLVAEVHARVEPEAEPAR